MKLELELDDDTDANNYRPISLLSNFNRVFKKIIYKRLTSYIEKHDLLNSSQYGFRKGHSTQHAILDIVNDIQSNMNQRLLSWGVFITGLPVWQTQSGSAFHLFVLFTLFFFVSVKVLPVPPLLSGVFVHKASCAYFRRIERVVGNA